MGRNRESRVVLIVKICKGRTSPVCNPRLEFRRHTGARKGSWILWVSIRQQRRRYHKFNGEDDTFEFDWEGSHEQALESNVMGERDITRPVYP